MSDSEEKGADAVSIVFAAGKGTRMLGYAGNKTLLPLIPKTSLYDGDHPLLLEVLMNLPPGPVGIVVNHCAADVKRIAKNLAAAFIAQPVTNGTGGALLAARSFLETVTREAVIITMGDVPLIRRTTYAKLIQMLADNGLAILAFQPRDRAQYGMLEIDEERVLRIVEWKYWRTYSREQQARLKFCNAGVYAAKRSVLLEYLDHLAKQPHLVRKQQGDEWVTIKEYFLTDLVELMSNNELPVGWVVAGEGEVAGVDTPEALATVQRRYLENRGR
jgi:bifunctional UDP-N-acetylglucosamine pyrophosphorylase / glucosamine-1-phosphate N-acetyltransferase